MTAPASGRILGSRATNIVSETVSNVPQTKRPIMWHVGIDLNRLTAVIATADDEGNARPALRIECRDSRPNVEAMRLLQPFRAVIKATGIFRWLYDPSNSSLQPGSTAQIPMVLGVELLQSVN